MEQKNFVVKIIDKNDKNKVLMEFEMPKISKTKETLNQFEETRNGTSA